MEPVTLNINRDSLLVANQDVYSCA